MISAAALKIPALFVIAHNDELPGTRPDIAHMAFDSLQGPKQLLEIEGGHFGLLYYPGRIFDEVAASQASFLREHLGLAK